MAGRCTECGRYHHSGPPCDDCGNMSFNPVAAVKACVECGAIHRGESPPCNECGEMGFRKVNPDRLQQTESDDSDTFPSPPGASRRSYLYAGGIVAVLGAGYYAFTSSNDYPTTTAPGEAESAGGIRFETVETEMHGRINDERGGADALSMAGNVDAFATYYNKKYVEAGHFQSVESDSFDGKFNVSGYQILANRFGREYSGDAIEYYEYASDVANACVDSWMESQQHREVLTSPEWSKLGLDVHTYDGDVFLLAVFTS